MKKLKTLLTDSLKNNESFKMISVNGQDIKISKIGLRHLNLIKNLDPTDEKAVEKYAQLFMPRCNWAEGEFVLVHVEHFNKKLENSVEYEGNIFNIEDLKISSETSFEYGEHVFKFKPLYFFERFDSDVDLLKSKYVSGPIVEDWGKMPAFVNLWAHNLRNTVSLTGSKGLTLKDGTKILEVFGSHEQK